MGKKLITTVALLLALASTAALATPAPVRTRTLAAFRNEAQFRQWLQAWQLRQKRVTARRAAEDGPQPMMMAMPAPAPSSPAASNAAASKSASLDAVSVTGSRIKTDDGITNVQTQGVDEGDIVKRHGDLLLVLRRGRLFTLRVGGDRLQLASMVNAYGPGIEPEGTWYDEMLVSDGTVAIIGLSYARGGTEVGLFDLDARGQLHYRATYQLRSNDYYSARNYASRLVGHTLVFYSPMQLDASRARDALLPGLRHWQGASTPAAFQRILPAQRIYRGSSNPPDDELALHTVSVCDLATRVMSCTSTAVLGPSGRDFYVSDDAVYVWTTANGSAHEFARSSVVRMPLDGSAPSALRTWGSPVDQMSFLQRDGFLNVLVASDGRGEGMWASMATTGKPALLRVPVSRFGDVSARATAADYRALGGTLGYGVQNRFVGDWLLYGGSAQWAGPVDRAVHAVHYATREPARRIALTHTLERIEALGDDAVLVGASGSDLRFSSLRLGAQPEVAHVYTRHGAAQGDARTHGFFYRPTTDIAGVLGLPIIGSSDESASVLYLRNRALALAELGTLDAHHRAAVDDGCKASCVDWYGNARPIFLGDRVFALLGYELVEGHVEANTIVERRRVDFTPGLNVNP